MPNGVPIPTTYVPTFSRLSVNDYLPINIQIDSVNFGAEDSKVCETIIIFHSYNKDNKKVKKYKRLSLKS